MLTSIHAITQVLILESGVHAHDAIKNLALILTQHGLQFFSRIGELGKALGKGRGMFRLLPDGAGCIDIGRQELTVDQST